MNKEAKKIKTRIEKARRLISECYELSSLQDVREEFNAETISKIAALFDAVYGIEDAIAEQNTENN